MPRKIRIEMPGACHHVINRGNYRTAMLADEGAKQAFLECVDEAMQRNGWRNFAWAIMINHFHLAIQTVEPNLVSGMQWLESTFAARFNRFRGEQGHLFQGRYKALLIEPGPALGAVCHYIHLNPVEAGVVGVDTLGQWRWTSFQWLQHPGKRPAWYDPRAALAEPCGLNDTAKGRADYASYLAWLASDPEAQRSLDFERMARGWAIGSDEFKQEILGRQLDLGQAQAWGSAESIEARELSWGIALRRLKTRLDSAEMSDPRKSADWRVALATHMKVTTTASNPWLARELGMGDPCALSRLTAECRSGQRAVKLLQRLISKSKA